MSGTNRFPAPPLFLSLTLQTVHSLPGFYESQGRRKREEMREERKKERKKERNKERKKERGRKKERKRNTENWLTSTTSWK
jgi:hypothetical protein